MKPNLINARSKKACSMCSFLKDRSEFSLGDTYCKPCRSEYMKSIKSKRISIKILSESEIKKELRNYKAPESNGVNALIDFERRIDRVLESNNCR